MWIWPSDRVVLDSEHSPSVLLARIAAQTDPQTFADSRPNATKRAYEGWVGDGSFRIRPAWSGRRHSFRVFIEGRVEPLGAGSRVDATLHLDWGTVLFFPVIGLVVAGAAVLRPIILGVAGPSRVFWILYLTLGLMGWLMLMAAYWAGHQGARGFLTSVATD